VECPCHGSTYDVKTGNVIERPAAKPLADVHSFSVLALCSRDFLEDSSF
jgi:Rieske Fe-S protein